MVKFLSEISELLTIFYGKIFLAFAVHVSRGRRRRSEILFMISQSICVRSTLRSLGRVHGVGDVALAGFGILVVVGVGSSVAGAETASYPWSPSYPGVDKTSEIPPDRGAKNPRDFIP